VLEFSQEDWGWSRIVKNWIRRSQYRNGEPPHVEAYRKRFGESGEEYRFLGEIDLLLSLFEDVGVGASCR
jgi:hypothetical protein